jgi:hypothetical protein
MLRIGMCSVLCFIATYSYTQSLHKFRHEVVTTPVRFVANDYWIAVPWSGQNAPGKYVEISVTTTVASMIHIRAQGLPPLDTFLAASAMFTYKPPIDSVEISTSGIVEAKGIHIWSDTGQISVVILCRNYQSAGTMNAVPMSAWGREYEVVNYRGLDAAFYAGKDAPSEFVLIAAEDSTRVYVKSTKPIRMNGNPSAGQYIDEVILHRGQTFQCMGLNTGADLTGIKILSNKPIGVISASVCPNIPADYASCDFICEMLMPSSARGSTYYSVPFTHRAGGDSFYISGTQYEQVVYFNDSAIFNGTSPYYFLRPDITKAGTWRSDRPFFLAQYINSSSWSDSTGQSNEGYGEPSMVALVPKEDYDRDVMFQVPKISSGTAFTAYANIIVAREAITKTTLDAMPLATFPGATAVPLPGSNYTAYRVEGLLSGKHRVLSDSAAGVYLYGYGDHEAYALNGGVAQGKRDTIPPAVIFRDQCFSSRISFTDYGVTASKIAKIVIDSQANLLTLVPNLHPNYPQDSLDCTVTVEDISRESYIRLIAIDRDGNSTIVTSRYTWAYPKIEPLNLTIAYAGPTVPNYKTIAFKNTSTLLLVFSSPNHLRFQQGDQGFSLVDPDLSDLAVGQSRTFLVQYVALDAKTRSDVLLFGNECGEVNINVRGTSVGPVAYTAGFDLNCIAVGTTKDDSVIVSNDGLFKLTILGVMLEDASHFKLISGGATAIYPGQQMAYHIRYTARKAGDTNSTLFHVETKELGDLPVLVKGCALETGSVHDEPIVNEHELREAIRSSSEFAWLTPTPNPSDRSTGVRFVFGLAKQAHVTLDLFDLLGKRMNAAEAKIYDGGIHEISVDTRLFAGGTYLYRYNVDGKPYGGMLTIR